ncbi:MAG: NAD(P)/FAD-dependent oxidoreductase [Candidatus Omnitrophica bacterium]|nr:NAD(P)/FAD-dependent oxidoreductase [Candidatus Omnitrophota bacterium]
MDKDVLIIGAGAAGLICAIEAGRRKRSVVILEHNRDIGRKLSICGGGRCNFTNINIGPEHYISQNPHFLKSALSRYRPENFCGLLKKHAVSYHEKKFGQLFCDNSAKEIIGMFIKECRYAHVSILSGIKINSLKKNHVFTVSTNKGVFTGKSLVIATGGLSMPSVGATDLGYRIARQFGLKITPVKPGLVPLIWDSKNKKIFSALCGVSVKAKASFKKISFTDNLLFTHKGLSGPAILQISSYLTPGDEICLDFIPELNFIEIFKNHSQDKIKLKNILKDILPQRLVEVLARHFPAEKPVSSYTPDELKKIEHILRAWKVISNKTQGYEKAEVTIGGVDTSELSSKTMESKKVPGLYFIGEVLDVSGHLGGYNLHWAWASGFTAGQYA